MIKKLQLDDGLFQDGRRDFMSVTAKLAAMERAAGYDPVKDNTAHLNALERQLLVRGIVHNSVMSAALSLPVMTVDEFYRSNDGNILFQEYFLQHIFMEPDPGERWLTDADLIYMTETIKSATTKTLKPTFTPGTSDAEMKRIVQGAEIPRVKIIAGENEIPLYKYGRRIDMTYEAVAEMRVDLVGMQLKLIAQDMAMTRLILALAAIVNGNSGESNSADNTNTGGVWAEGALDSFFLDFHPPYTINLLAATHDVLGPIYALSGFKPINAGNPLLTTGKLPAIFGGQVKLVNPNYTTALSTTKLLAMDNKGCLRKSVKAGSQMVEEDSLITSQWKRVVVTEYITYVKDGDRAAQTMTKT